MTPCISTITQRVLQSTLVQQQISLFFFQLEDDPWTTRLGSSLLRR